MRRLTLLVFAALISCSPNASTGSLRVVVDFEAGVKSTCVKLVARGSTDRESMPVPVAGKSSLVFGVAQLGEANSVDVQALGFSDETCMTRTVPQEESEVLTTQFGTPTTQEKLTLKIVSTQNQNDGGTDGGGMDGGVDMDGDGYTSDVDCDDNSAGIHPNAAEQCGNQLDDDCDNATDCADPMCDAQQCRVGMGNRCVMDACAEINCNDTLDNDFDGTTDCADSNCNGATCGTNGTCIGTMCVAPTEVGLCADGVDNDGDNFTDCADTTDCPNGTTCSDGDPCTGNDQCSGNFCGAGAVLTCNMAPSACFSNNGSCQADAGGCVYPVNMSNSCDDGLFCTVNTCVADGGCAAVAKMCNAPPAGGCFASTGTCVETDGGPCSYTPLPLGTMGCTDNDNCTVGDSCNGDGGCVGGVRTTCTPPGECFMNAGCDVGGTCQYSVRTGSCTGGACLSDGGCGAQTIFTYVPSNFTEPDLPATAGTMTVNCTTTINTQTADGGTDWNTCGIGPAAPARRILGNGAVLIFADALTVNAQLRAVGARPLIIAVRNNVTLNSTVNVSTDSSSTGAGANAGCLPAERGGDGEASGSPETAGGGGGGAFGSNGGSGANGENGGPRGDAGVVSNTNLTLTPLRGGCRGGNGGRAGANGGSAGRPGGAVQISAGGTVTLNTGGSVQANGQGGEGGQNGQRVGGGGGGSGGAILLEGTSLTMNAIGVLAANGGAGGEASGGTVDGATGQNGQVSGSRAQCFAGTGCGGNGGDGAASSGAAENGFDGNNCTNSAGGGGGGGVGRVRLNFTTCNFDGAAIVSPASTSATAGCVR